MRASKLGMVLLCGSLAAVGWGQSQDPPLAKKLWRQDQAIPQEGPAPDEFQNADCPYFGEERTRWQQQVLGKRTAVTEMVLRQLGNTAATDGAQSVPGALFIPGGGNTDTFTKTGQLGTIDKYIFQALQQASVNPAPRTTDQEFIRRVTLDLTGRIPTPDRVTSFLADTATDKRAKLIDELLAKPEWVDKWTMYYGDLYKNNRANAFVTRSAQGRNAFYQWIKNSLAGGKPYNQMATELISATSADNSVAQGAFAKGEVDWLPGSIVTGTGIPIQDTYDQAAADTAETFLGIAHVNCLLCHNGAGHLTSLSLWGKSMTRQQAWGFASYFAKTQYGSATDPGSNARYYYLLQSPANAVDYALNTTTGNRPARQPATPTSARNVPPAYLFNNHGAVSGEPYRLTLAREITSDFQFARATVNYIWAEFFGAGIVDPPNQFDPARLDPDNPPPAPWSLQPSNARLLNALATDFIASGYDLQALMREIANSQTYQLSSRYNGTWNPSWETLNARHMVRRLWAEEIHDSIVQASNILPSYTIRADNDTFGPVSFAMQFPETQNTPDGGGATSQFLDAFIRGNRVDQERTNDTSALQALMLMNNNFVMTRIRSTGSGVTASLLQKNMALANDQLVNNLYLTVLGRYPAADEMATATASLASGNRTQAAENLLWTLYNKVDFIFNY